MNKYLDICKQNLEINKFKIFYKTLKFQRNEILIGFYKTLRNYKLNKF